LESNGGRMKNEKVLYSLTEKGKIKNFDDDFYTFFPEELIIMELLNESPQTINMLKDKINKINEDRYKRRLIHSPRSYDYTQSRVNNLMIEGFIEKLEKRNCRSEVLLDKDDLSLLTLCSKKEQEIPFLIKMMNISHKGLLVHIHRLKKEGFIEKLRTEKNYKVKNILITEKGLKVLNLIKSDEK
jgi:DNA-binding PadR family transcriptional regulator